MKSLSGQLFHVAFTLLLMLSMAYGFGSFRPVGRHNPEQVCNLRGGSSISLFNGFGFGFDRRPSKDVSNKEMVLLEEDVVSSAQAQIDRKRIMQALSEEREARATPQWAAAIAASIAAGVASSLVVQNIPVGVFVALSVGFVASRDPIAEDDSAGAIARTVGRYTIASVEAATPKAKAIARAALTGEEEVAELRERIVDTEAKCIALQEENARLKLWQKRRIWVDKVLPNYSLQELKEESRANGLQVGGTKTQLLMRLVEAKVIEPELEAIGE